MGRLLRNPSQKMSPHGDLLIGNFEWNGRIVLIGASTGGVEAIETILAEFPRNCPPTLIAQHMPEKFLRAFARRLNQRVLPDVLLAKHGLPVAQGQVCLAPGGATHLELFSDIKLCCQIGTYEKVNGYRPSIDVLFKSATRIADSVVGILLTGMGTDGAKGLLSLRNCGAISIAQDEASSAVYGMPRAAVAIGAVGHQLGLPQIAAFVISSCSKTYTDISARGVAE